MLVLSRKIDETITIGENIQITITAIRGRQVRIAIDAPEELTILRGELLQYPRGLSQNPSFEPAFVNAPTALARAA